MPAATLRARTTLLVVAVTGLTLVIGAVALVLTLHAQLQANSDDADRARLRELLGQAEAGTLPRELQTGEDGIAQAVAADGRVLAASENIAGRSAIADLDPGGDLTVTTLEAPDDDETERFRLWAGRAETPDGPVVVYVGTSTERVDEATDELRGALVIGVPLVLALLGLATWYAVGRALRRVDAITAEVATITDTELHRRVPESPVDDEVGRLARTMNTMLTRLEDARDRQRAFVADTSHDLQSPLAAQRALLEVALADPARTDLGGLARELLAVNSDLERLVRDLLFLASYDAGAAAPADQPLDLDDVVLEEAARARPATDVRIDTSGVSGAPVRGDRGELQRLVRNLVDNAVRHAATTVTVRLSGNGAGARLEVADDGPGVPAADRDRIFDRFYRGDSARSRQDGGSGLGLAIARTVAERHGGTLQLAAGSPGATFVLSLPPA